jgi:hypothetical protein
LLMDLERTRRVEIWIHTLFGDGETMGFAHSMSPYKARQVTTLSFEIPISTHSVFSANRAPTSPKCNAHNACG